jgi:hypothetical protein
MALTFFLTPHPRAAATLNTTTQHPGGIPAGMRRDGGERGVPQALAELRRVRCRATSKRTGERCGQWCAPGHVVCYAHGGRSPQAVRSAKVRAAVAEIMATDPRRTPREVLGDALHITDLVLRDWIADLWTRSRSRWRRRRT